MATNKKIVKKTESVDKRGKKGGLSVVTPEIVGAMTGAAIGGLAGMMLGNKKTRERLAVVKDQAVTAAQDALENIEIKSEEVADVAHNVRQKADELPEKIKTKTKKS